MPKKGASAEHNWSFAFSPRRSHPRPKLFQEDRRTLDSILVDSMKDYKYKKHEMFKRMKVTTFAQMILHVAEFQYHEELPTLNETDTPFRPDTADLEIQKIQSDGRSKVGSSTSPDRMGTHRSPTREGLLQRMGHGKPDSATCSSTRALVSGNACPYLLLDIRDKDDFMQCHIITAKSYPTPTLARAVNYESKDMLRFRNQEGRVIILYDNEESEQTIRAATTLVERGYENLFLLTGGLKEAYRIFPKGLITGAVPLSFFTHEGHGVKVGRVKATSQPPTSREAARRSDFTQDDLDCLHIYLDNALKDNSSGSRLTQNPRGPAGRTNTRLSSLSSSTNTTGTGRPPFRP